MKAVAIHRSDPFRWFARCSGGVVIGPIVIRRVTL